MHPGINNLKAELQGVLDVLRRPSDADSTLQQLLADRFHCERQQTAVLEWVPRATAQLDDMAAEIEALKAENAKLQAAAAPVLTMLPDEVSDPVDEITGHKRPPALHAVDNVG